MEQLAKRACSIEQVGKNRAGKSRFWCSVHQAPATGRYGVRLPECESAYREVDLENIVEIDIDDYPGGVGVWGAVRPAFDTTNLPEKAGIHVHARKGDGPEKAIDETAQAVRLRYRKDLLDRGESLLTKDTAVSFYISRFLNRKIKHLFCIHCGELHLDADFYAVKPHKKHLCHACGKYFVDDERAVSNPISLLREKGGIATTEPVRPDRAVAIKQVDFPGGIQIWGSNPALLWTATRPEDEGLHLHAYDANGHDELNDTYSQIKLDDVLLNEEHIKQFMAQSALAYLKDKVVCLRCPKCHEALFDKGDDGFFPHINHRCQKCGHHFIPQGPRKRVVSNPFIEVRAQLIAVRN